MSELYSNKKILAPMVRAGRTPLRLLCLKYGADLCYTEEIVDKKLIESTRIVNEALGTIDYRNGDDIILRLAPEEKGRCILQIGTNSGEKAAKIARIVGDDVAGIDVNMGCPKPFSIHCGMGAALLTKTDTIIEILTSLKAAAKVPVSCKIRVLDNREDTIKLVKEIEKCGVSALGVHGRRRDERQPDQCRVEEVKEVAETITSIPIITNGFSGEIDRFEDIEKWREATGTSSIMIARKALSTPSIFRKEGILDKYKDIENFLELACQYDESYTMTKYVVQRILGGDQEHDPRGKATVAAGSVLQICKAFGMEDVYNKWKDERKKKESKKRARVDDDGTYNIEVSFPLKRLKNSVGFSPTPKMVLHDYCVEQKLPKPIYETVKREDKRFVSTACLGEKKYRSGVGQPNLRMAEQVAALAALHGMDIRSRLEGNWEED
uniref:DRBM domain-containing protein n=2 Tax=Caenorhabditis tropicalis TaxID=1561998 RepID=A0A1I7USU8_9PELO